ncbi:MAG: DUF2442 domain-containing protein [Bacteroidetes bacterium]|jgi:hypothetical protein|nr:DUF2442 domain-containing protein [Bacteroidota bacterium]MBT6686419.1 DUF2442 domain-containing protein [Bacteroidota bacterium]MBT7142252.1 DUF2442 domain-containing protein [Bacteroidota bacterium]MBT7491604.1 DUF2442 domain-containing protein [Bacteroidota bacterium]
MSILIQNEPLAYKLKITEDELIVFLKDGRSINVPLVWYPSLENATKEQLENYEILGDGEGIHWIDLDEDLSICGFFQGISLQDVQVA